MRLYKTNIDINNYAYNPVGRDSREVRIKWEYISVVLYSYNITVSFFPRRFKR